MGNREQALVAPAVERGDATAAQSTTAIPPAYEPATTIGLLNGALWLKAFRE